MHNIYLSQAFYALVNSAEPEAECWGIQSNFNNTLF
jgi:hypothetical protein